MTKESKKKARRFAAKETGLWVGYRPSVIDYVAKQRRKDKDNIRKEIKLYI